MCGITGFISKKFGRDELQVMTDCISHRGPDADGYLVEQYGSATIGLGHRRLSILDLSAVANQPMESQCGRYVIIYNGEVYNFEELREKIPGFKWRTTGDTEVILECFAKFGTECLPWFNGMFALTIMDRQEKVLYAARDRMGIKPFFYCTFQGEFIFASELKAIQAVAPPQPLNMSAITNFLYLGYIPQNQTIYTSSHKLQAGCFLKVTEHGIAEEHRYWRLEDQVLPAAESDEPRAKEELKTIMEDSVKRCMISDVPLGILLSGGVDSSLVAAIAQRHSKQKIKTFSIAFQEGKYDESEYAQQMADHIGSDHHQFTVREEQGIAVINDFLNIYDEPYGDMSGIPSYLVSQLARKEVTVALCGDGADELFLGYGFYTWAKKLDNRALKPFFPLIGRALGHMRTEKFRSKQFLFSRDEKTRKSNTFSQCHGNWTLDEAGQLLLQPPQYSFPEALAPHARTLNAEEEQSFFDLKNYLPEELLTKMDRASMRHGLEVRVPFLDSQMIDFAVNLSPDLKYKNGIQKYLLKEVLYDYAPRSFFARPKWGFAVPMREWLEGKLSYLVEDYLAPQKVEEAGILDNEEVQEQVARFRSGEHFRYHRIWLLIVLQKWLLEKRHTYTTSSAASLASN